jgi:hypothetical protein
MVGLIEEAGTLAAFGLVGGAGLAEVGQFVVEEDTRTGRDYGAAEGLLDSQVSATALPAASMTERCVVLPPCPRPSRRRSPLLRGRPARRS